VQHREKLDTLADASNRQILDAEESSLNRQILEGDSSAINRQTIDSAFVQTHREALSPEERLHNIHEVVEVVSDRLNRFETDHFGFLQIGRAFKLSDSFALFDEDDSGLNRQLVDESYRRMGVHFEGAQEEPETAVTSKSGADTVPVHLDASADAHASNQMKGRAIDAPAVHVAVSTKRKSLSVGKAWLWRGRGFVYVQLFIASMTLAFASPIEIQGLKRREVIGPLWVAPVLVPAVTNAEGEFDSQLLPVPSVR